MPTSISNSGAEKRIRSAAVVTVTTTAATNKRLSAVSTPQCFHGPAGSSSSRRALDAPTVRPLRSGLRQGNHRSQVFRDGRRRDVR